MTMPSDNLTTGILAVSAPIFGQIVSFLTSLDPIAISIAMFVVGKLIDVAVRIYLTRKKQ